MCFACETSTCNINSSLKPIHYLIGTINFADMYQFIVRIDVMLLTKSSGMDFQQIFLGIQNYKHQQQKM